MSVIHAFLASKRRYLSLLLLNSDFVVNYRGNEVHRLAIAQKQALALDGHLAAVMRQQSEPACALLLWWRWVKLKRADNRCRWSGLLLPYENPHKRHSDKKCYSIKFN